jgi:hypothetical protein
MKLVAALFVALEWLWPLSIAGAAPKPFPEMVPAVVKVEYDHDMWGIVIVEFKDGRLICQRRGMEGNRVSATRPTLDQWAHFFHELNEAKVYKWSDYYPLALAVPRDGNFRWEIDLQVGDVRFQSNGNTAFPLDGDLTEEQRGNSKNRSFDLCMEAVSHLIGEGFPSSR